jgi:hypothetical protein
MDVDAMYGIEMAVEAGAGRVRRGIVSLWWMEVEGEGRWAISGGVVLQALSPHGAA